MRIDLAHASAGEVERRARPGHVAEDEVVDAGRRNAPGRGLDHHATSTVRGLGKHGSARRLPATLELRRGLVDAVKPPARIAVVHRKRDEPEGDTIAGGAELLGRAHADRDDGAERLAGHGLAADPERCTDCAADHGEHDVVHGAPQAVCDRLHRCEVEVLPCDLAARADRAVEAHLRSRREARCAPAATGCRRPPRSGRPRRPGRQRCARPRVRRRSRHACGAPLRRAEARARSAPDAAAPRWRHAAFPAPGPRRG